MSDLHLETAERAVAGVDGWTPTLPRWQHRTLERLVEALELGAEDLDYTDRRFLVWLAGWDDWTEAAFYRLLSRYDTRRSPHNPRRAPWSWLSSWATQRIHNALGICTITNRTDWEGTRVVVRKDGEETETRAEDLWTAMLLVERDVERGR